MGVSEPSSADHGDVLYDIGKSEEVGRYMVAKRDLEPGEVIFTDKPAVIGPDSNSIPLCLVCWRSPIYLVKREVSINNFRPATGEFKCPDCLWPLCNGTCQQTDAHQSECAFFKSRESDVNISVFKKPNNVYDAILPLRVLLLKITNRRVYDLICLLMDHQEARTEAKLKKYRRISDLIRMRWNFKQDFTEEEVIKVMGILSVNSFCVHDGEEEGTGLIGLYPWTSLMSHSCLPNIKIVTKSDFSYICSAVVKIGQGTEIVTSYHHFYYHLFGTNNRREHIRANWKFDCNCTRCQDPTERGTFVNGVKCSLCEKGISLPTEPLKYNSTWQCLACRGTENWETVTGKIRTLETRLENIPDCRPDQLEQVLTEVGRSLHENHYLVTDTERRIIDIYGHHKERKVQYCNHLLLLAETLSPGQSELRGYLLWERCGAQLHLQNLDTGEARNNNLLSLANSLREVVNIFGQIREDSLEGLSGRKAELELERIEEQIRKL